MWPLVQLDGPAPQREYRLMPRPSTCVAIVHDHPGVLKALAQLIAAHSFHPQTYISARDFLESLAQAPPDCLLVDQQMPDMTGLELKHELSCAGFNIPTIVITAHDEPDFQQQCESAGAMAYLLKPLDRSTLIAAITWAIAMGSTSKRVRVLGRQVEL
jgi:FixJ family two-component response regulator